MCDFHPPSHHLVMLIILSFVPHLSPLPSLALVYFASLPLSCVALLLACVPLPLLCLFFLRYVLEVWIPWLGALLAFKNWTL